MTRRKVLIIAYHSPPDPGVGALRPAGLAKYLPQYGWEPVLLTSGMRGIERRALKDTLSLHEVPPFDMTRFLNNPFSRGVPEDHVLHMTHRLSSRTRSSPMALLKLNIKSSTAWPDRNNGWWLPAFRKGRAIIECEKIDLIVSTSPPWTDALVAASLHKATGVPWIADCRDLWSQYHMYDFGPIRLALDRWLERRTFNRCAVLNVVSKTRARQLRTRFPDKRIEAVTLGYDPEHFAIDGIAPPCDVFTITHVGKLLRRARADPYFRALAELLQDGIIPRGRVASHFWGPVEAEQKQLAWELGLTGSVFFHDLVPRADVIRRELASHLLLLCTWSDPNQPGVHPGKFFDYLGARRPILAVGNHRDVVTDVLDETGSGVHLASVPDLKQFLADTFLEFQASGEVSYQGNDTALRSYSYEAIAQTFSRIMGSVACEAVPSPEGRN